MVGDLDCLVHHPRDFVEMVHVVRTLMGYEEIRGGTLKSEGIVQYKGSPLLLNFWNVPEPSATGAMLLFSTGPYDLNIAMRARAKSTERTLSQYGLFDIKTGKQLDKGYEEFARWEDLEKDIFEQLGYEYLTPVERETWRDRLLKKPTKKTAVSIASSNGVDVYQVILEDGKAIECECKGFTYRQRCRHLQEAEEKYAGSK